MLQQTRMEVVVPYFERFIQKFPDVQALAASDLDEVLSIWSGLGYYRRARMLHQAAQVISERHAGSLPADVELLRAIPGIGRYTAGALASIAFDLHAPVVEGNVRRVLSRLENLDDVVGSSALERKTWTLASGLVDSARSPRMLNQGLMEFGALLCKAAVPRCEICPLSDLCQARSLSRVDVLPRAAPVRKSRSLSIPVYVVDDGGGRILVRRESGSLMTGMLHLPHGNDQLLPQASVNSFRPVRLLGQIRHTVTNRRIRFSVWTADTTSSVADCPDEYTWIAPEDLHRHPHPSYVRKAVDLYLKCHQPG
ncbi:MAG: A/G-specific adenine glycosylase [Acidobacteriota bacterium]